ncbi:uncharacterized protein [Littorina saxatilis]|uniref:uncharacterized protein n=1 Tax=Littorina saxatilis TaxID=31220 RepID=UPI0038B51822
MSNPSSKTRKKNGRASTAKQATAIYIDHDVDDDERNDADRAPHSVDELPGRENDPAVDDSSHGEHGWRIKEEEADFVEYSAYEATEMEEMQTTEASHDDSEQQNYDLQEAEFRSSMDSLGDFMAKSRKSCVITPEKFAAIVEFLKDPQDTSGSLRSWIRTRGFQLMDFDPDQRDVLVRPAYPSRKAKSGEQVGSELLPVLHSRSLYDVTKHVHTTVFQHAGYKRVLAYMQARYFGATRGYVQQFCSTCPLCKTFRPRFPSTNFYIQPEHTRRAQYPSTANPHFQGDEAHGSFDMEAQESFDGEDSSDVVYIGEASHAYTPQLNASTSQSSSGFGGGEHNDVMQGGRNGEEAHLSSDSRDESVTEKTTKNIDNRKTRTIVDGEHVYIVTVQEDSDMDEPGVTAGAEVSKHDQDGDHGEESRSKRLTETCSGKQNLTEDAKPTSSKGQQSAQMDVKCSGDSDPMQHTGNDRFAKNEIIRMLSRKRTMDDSSGNSPGTLPYPVAVSFTAANDLKSHKEAVEPGTSSATSSSAVRSNSTGAEASPSTPKKTKARRSSHSPESCTFFSEVQVDIIDMTNCPDDDFRFICHVLDPSQKLHVLFPLREASASVVAPKLDQRVLALYGMPGTLYSNMGHGYVEELIMCLSGIVEGEVPCSNGEAEDRGEGERKRYAGTNVVEELIAMLRVERSSDPATGATPWLAWLPRIMRSLNRDWHVALRQHPPIVR